METFNQLWSVLRQRVYNVSSSALEHAVSTESYLPTTMPSAFPSLRSIAKVALGSAQVALLSSGNTVSGGSPESCPNPQLSCHNTTAQANTCCFNTPGGQLLQTQFWDSHPATGPADHWTVHGLWPDHCDGTFDQYCDSSRQYTNITAILQSYGATDLLGYMDTYWKDQAGDDESFWEHEWGKHGTCISTLNPSCYTNYTPQEEVLDFFNKTVQLFQGLDSYSFLSAAGILPSTTQTYTSAQIQAALTAPRGVSVVIGCTNSTFNEIWYFYNVLGSVQTGQFESTGPDGSKSSCPSTGIQYLPKNLPSTPTDPSTSASTTTLPASTAPSAPFQGSGFLEVQASGKSQGCIISPGTWYIGGTCATFSATASGDGFTLTSSKGNCAIVNNALSCASSIITPGIFSTLGGNLAVGGDSAFYASAVPAGSTQQQVSTLEASTALTVTWQST
ncbi:MAG: ribonuclease T2 [Lasallia pustulata]|uniref:Ribonuclease T2-like n=1 Tax=Lasallia pustulata TaxID=136370 RepID=A0A5M8PAW2_9LECA|nr:MAG: ribonuclease T2 [Lasallia pustulata]